MPIITSAGLGSVCRLGKVAIATCPTWALGLLGTLTLCPTYKLPTLLGLFRWANSLPTLRAKI